MKKILLTILIILLLVLIYIVGFKGMKIGAFRIDSIYGIKDNSNKLDMTLAKATEITLKTYPETKKTLDNSITDLKTTKEKYQLKIANMSDSSILEYTQLDNYEKEFLWTNIGNYAKNENVKLSLDITEIQEESKYYNLNFTVVGKYSNVANFIYDIENDDELNFKITDFKMNPYSTTETTTITKYEDGTGQDIKSQTKDKPYEYSKEITTSEEETAKTQTNSINTLAGTTTINNSTTSKVNSPDRVQATFVVTRVNINMN